MNNPSENLKQAEKGPILSIVVYLLLSLAKLLVGYLIHSSSLIADGFNNMSDIVGNATLLIGLRMARKPADSDHKFGHWKIEDLASLLTSFIMFIVGLQVLVQTIEMMIANTHTPIDPLGALVGLISALCIYAVYRFNQSLARKLKSGALIAAAKDNLTDIATSLGTTIAIVASRMQFPVIDKMVAIIISLFIIKTAFEIFKSSAFSLSDGFDDKRLAEYKVAILKIPKILSVKSQRGRTYGSNVYLDLVLEMHPDLSVFESHAITEEVETLLKQKFGVYDIDIHVEPAKIQEDRDNELLYKTLYKNEKLFLSKIPDYEKLLADDFYMIATNGQYLSLDDLQATDEHFPNNFKAFQLISVSPKIKLVTYQLENSSHTSLWRRHEEWQLIFHQITKKNELF
ncbi:cation diffusion facilitator family transporter [Streptococcus sp. CSL10205-OR2]|uniref:cation diffusion facilitator family transporter n=1 Tax=Streptococcus sp. CSL10205-OR2 TaxID=2980558 RepID=UPI0021D95AA7|nr:cation diffusion facilitator family transporter [Streptococcus sp. CSL10205-OR2]MCU9533310.1 cation diffusion facilitator family transporter [Streptococcus sp. CSL10205-OR2]